MAAPTNVSAATAIPLTLPTSLTQDVNDAGTTYTVWYSYVSATDGVLGLFAYGDAIAYTVRTNVWTGSPGALVAYLLFNTVASSNDALQIPVAASGVYYFEFLSVAGNVTPAVLTLVVERAAAPASAVGDIGINAETDGGPLVVLDGTTGVVKRFRSPFENGEYGASLPDGHLCVEDKYDDTVSVYTGGGLGALVGTVSLGSAHGSQPSVVVGSNRTNRFYLGRSLASVSTEVYTLTLTGTLSGALWTLPTTPLQALAVNLTDTVLYYAAYAYGAPIAAWDLVGNVALPDLAAGLTNYLLMPDLFVLADGSILAAYVKNATGAASTLVKRYSAAGATLNTYSYNFGNIATVRLACAVDDPASFWLKRHVTGGQVTYAHIRSSDGVELASLTGAEFQDGVSSYPFPLDGSAHYGNAASCPFWLIETTDDDGGGGGGGGDEPPLVAPATETDTRYLRRLRRAPHVANDNKRVFLRTFELDLERGQGLATGQGSDPMVLLRLSRDGGQTWGEEIRMRAGALGAYTQRVLARRLGHARDTVFEVTVSDPIAWSLVGAWLDVEPGAH